MAIADVWQSSAAYYEDLAPELFMVPNHEDLALTLEDGIKQTPVATLQLVAELDGRIVGWLFGHLEPPDQNARVQMQRERAWTRLVIDAVVVERSSWRQGIGRALVEEAERWGAGQGARIVRLETYAHSPVSVPFYEHVGYRQRSIGFEKLIPPAPPTSSSEP